MHCVSSIRYGRVSGNYACGLAAQSRSYVELALVDEPRIPKASEPDALRFLCSWNRCSCQKLISGYFSDSEWIDLHLDKLFLSTLRSRQLEAGQKQLEAFGRQLPRQAPNHHIFSGIHYASSGPIAINVSTFCSFGPALHSSCSSRGWRRLGRCRFYRYR